MGKTTMPLNILVTEEMYNKPEIQKLIEQGHTVEIMQTVIEYDRIFHPNAWNMHHDYMDYLPVALKTARARRYPERTKRGKSATKKDSGKRKKARKDQQVPTE